MSSLAVVPLEIREAWRPPEKLTVSQWAEKYRVLEAETSSEPGPWRNQRTPYLVGIMDAFSDPYIEKIVFNKGSQLGGTSALYNMLGFAIHQDPGPTLFVMPTLELARHVSRKRIQPMIEGSPVLKSKKPANEDDFNTLEMLLPGMVLTMAGANSPASLASRPCRYVFLDEVNKFPRFSGQEADPISLSMERQKTFWNRKAIITSTPTTEDGQITRELATCEVIFDYWVPCPHCGKMQQLFFEHIKWPRELDRGDPNYAGRVRELATYECAECEASIEDYRRPAMLVHGEWRPREKAKAHPRSVGFHLPSFYSPWLTWGDMAEIFVKSRDFPEKFMNVVNSWWAQPWIPRISSVEEEEIEAAKVDLPPQTVPQEAVALTSFVDVQKYGRWFAVRAWARDFTSWLIHYGLLPTWEDVEKLLFETSYPVHESDRTMNIWRAAVDTGGGRADDGISMTEDTYLWLRQNMVGRGCRVWGTKGASGSLSGKLHIGKPLDKTPSGRPIPGGLQIIQLDTGKLKDAFHYRLDLAIKGMPQGAYLHSEVDDIYFKQIMAEEKRVDRRGIQEWVQVKKENHMLDCEVGCLILADPEWPGGGVNLLQPAGGSDPGSGKGQAASRMPRVREAPAVMPNASMRGRTINPWARRAHG